MKTFRNPDVTVEFGVGKGAGHDHLCVRINGEVLLYAHIMTHPTSPTSTKDITVSFWECDSEVELSAVPITWKDRHGDLHLKSF